MIASFLDMGVDLPSIALIVLHSSVGSVLWSNVSTNCLQFCLLCSFVILVISSSGSEVILCSHLFQYLSCNQLRVESSSSRVYVV